MVLAGLNNLLSQKTEQAKREPAEEDTVRIYKKSGAMDYISDALTGGHATHPIHLPAVPLALTGTTLAAGTAGYLGMDKLLDSLRKRTRQRELKRAKKDYEQALAQVVGGQKEAEDRGDFAKSMDRICDALAGPSHDKLSADDGGNASRMISLLTGLYILGMGTAGGLGFQKGFKSQRAGSKSRAVDRAQLEKQLNEQKIGIPRT